MLTEVGAGAKVINPSLIGRAVVFEIIGIGSNPMGCSFCVITLKSYNKLGEGM